MIARRVTPFLILLMTAGLGITPAQAAQALQTQGAETIVVIVDGTQPQILAGHGIRALAGTPVEVVDNGPAGGIDEVHLANGTFILDLQNTGGGPGGPIPGTCIDTFSGTGVATVSGGTGAYTGISGTGTFSFHGAFVATKTPQGGCTQEGTVYDVVVDQGTITFS